MARIGVPFAPRLDAAAPPSPPGKKFCRCAPGLQAGRQRLPEEKENCTDMSVAKVLIVHNNATEAARLAAGLGDLGYVASTLSSGHRAGRETAAVGPDVAVVDLGLEGEPCGIEVAQQLGQFDVPVIYLTDDTDGDLLQRAEATRPYGYVLKTVEARQLHLSIKTALAMHLEAKWRRTRESRLCGTIDDLLRQTRIMDTILNSTRDGIIAADGDGRILFANSPAEGIVGPVEDIRPGELYDSSERQKKYGLFQLDKKTYLPADQSPLVSALQGKAIDDKEVFVRNDRRPEGAYVNVTSRTLWSGDRADIEGAVVFLRDVNREKEAEAELQRTVGELREQAQLLEAVFESMDAGVIVLSSQSKLLLSNAKSVQMMGGGLEVERTDEWSRNRGTFYPDRQTLIPGDQLPIMRALRGETLDNVEVIVRNAHHPEGLYLSVSGRPLWDTGGQIRAGVAILHDITRLKRTENRLERTVRDLRYQTHLMQTVFDDMEEGVVIADTQGNFLLANRRREEIIGMKLIALQPSEWPRTFGAFYLDGETHFPTEELPIVRAMRGEATEDIELFVRNFERPGGVYVRARGRPLLDNNEVVAGVAIFSDITKYKQTESELERTIHDLRRQAQLVDTVFESISDGVVVANPEGEFTIFNSSAEQIVGKGMGASSPDLWQARYGIFQADQKTPVATEQLPLLRAMQGESIDDEDLFICNEERPEGVFISVNGRPLQGDSGSQTGGGVITFRDVTKRKLAEADLDKAMQELRDQSELMEAAFNSISEGLVVVNTEGEVLSINPAGRQIMGFDAMDPSHTRLVRKWANYYYVDRETLIPPSDLPINRAVFQGEAISEMNLFVHSPVKPDGFFMRCSVRPLLHPKGDIRGAVGIFRDVSDEMRAEESLVQAFSQGRLEMIDTILHNIGNAINSVMTGVETLHHHLADEPYLPGLHALAEAIGAHRDDWPDYVAHDPQGQKVMPFIIALDDDLARQRAYVTKTVARVRERTNHIVDIVRTQKALDSPHMVRKDVNLETALSAAARFLHDSLNKRGIRVEVQCKEAPQEIRIQESRFHQMMVNLIKNSMEAIDDLAAANGLKEVPLIRIRAYPEGDFLHLDVIDNGIGIDTKNTRPLFAAGYTTKRTGSGLGLHSAANFVIGSGGQVQALSDGIGKGTTLRVMLRLSSVTPQPVLQKM